MKPRHIIILLLLVAGSNKSFSQDEDLLGLVEQDEPKKEYVYNAFKSSRVIMAHSMEMLRPGVLDFRILHRFGRINGGAYEFFGLDGPATVRLGLDYGISDDLTIGIGRSTFNKELDGFLKWRIIHQATGPKALPFSLVAVAGSTLTTIKWSDPSRENYFSSRMAHYGQLIIGRRFSEGVSIQLMPTIVHRNLVPTVNALEADLNSAKEFHSTSIIIMCSTRMNLPGTTTHFPLALILKPAGTYFNCILPMQKE
jgi:hypothetical protein